MNNRTFKVIVILVGLLFLNIEAAQAGLIQRFKVYIGHEFPGNQPLYILAVLLPAAILCYIILIPISFKDNGRLVSGYYTHQSFGSKRNRVRKISNILKEQGTLD